MNLINSMKRLQKQKSFYWPKSGDKTFPECSNVKDSCPMIIDNETQIDP